MDKEKMINFLHNYCDNQGCYQCPLYSVSCDFENHSLGQLKEDMKIIQTQERLTEALRNVSSLIGIELIEKENTTIRVGDNYLNDYILVEAFGRLIKENLIYIRMEPKAIKELCELVYIKEE